ncbi:MAG: arginine--tRNA ligase, partial [Candidatus Peribacteraceae bacterium]|nr:arginine--tRNA ligase [Candidatus Peribacteraceae bacterium]
HLGFSVVGINYIGDWGTQFGKLAVALKKWGEKPVSQCSVDDLLALYVRFHDEAEKDAVLEDEARAVFQKLEKGDKELEKFLQDVVTVTMADVEQLYGRLHVKLDTVRGEYYYRNAMEPIIAEGIRKKLFVEGEEGALIVRFPEESGLPVGIVRKGDGASVYLTRDLAAVRDRIDTWHPSAILYVVDVSQSLHLQQLFETCRLLQWELPALEHVVFGHMRFADKSMSTRKGNILKLQEVLDEAVRRADGVITEHEKDIQTDDRPDLAEMMGIGAVVYGILSQNRKADIVFDWKKVLAFDGNSAPYLQYTHARALSVLRKAEQKSCPLPSSAETLSDRERTLMGTLLDFPHALEEACSMRMPHTLTNYLYGLCQEFNAFYNTEPILKADDSAVRVLRLALTSLTATVIKTGAELLTLRVPDRM